MSLNPSQEALKHASALENELIFSAQKEATENIEMRLLGFCMSQLGQRNFSFEPLDGANIQELLNHNDIHHRRIDAPRNPHESEFPLLIVFDVTDQIPLALYRRGGSNWIYNPSNEKHYRFPSELQLEQIAFEIYVSLPVFVSGPLSILRFAFAPELAAVLALVITSAVVMLFNLSIPMLTNLLVTKILPQNDQQLLLQGFAVVILILIGSVATQYLQTLMMLRLESVADLRLQSAVWDRLMRLPMSFINQYTTGDLASRVISISKLRQLLGSGVLSTFISSLFAISFFVLMYIYDSQLAIWATGFTLISLFCLIWLTFKSIALELPLMESGADITNFSLQLVMGMPQIRSAGAEPFLLLSWIRRINRYALLQLRNNLFNDAMEQYATLVSPLASLFLFAVVTYRIINSETSDGINQIIVAFVAFYAAFSSFNGALTGAVNLISDVAGRTAVLWKRAEPVIYANVERGYQADAIRHNLMGNYKLRNIDYVFPGGSEPLFSKLNITIPASQHTAITGPSGCGKTTLVRMLLGFVSPQAGELMVDGIPLNQLAIRFYRRQMGVVMQTSRLSPGSIYDIVTGGLSRSDNEVWDALQSAAVAEEIRAMPMQLETIISDSGGNFSGGQVQRIAIARALINNPKVLIMDEATSALDNTSQLKISQTMQSLGITRISIAHRLSTIQCADQIVVLQRDEPAVSGCWDELKNYGYIKKMLESH
jgi:ATP-binding cassette subfamily B protein